MVITIAAGQEVVVLEECMHRVCPHSLLPVQADRMSFFMAFKFTVDSALPLLWGYLDVDLTCRNFHCTKNCMVKYFWCELGSFIRPKHFWNSCAAEQLSDSSDEASRCGVTCPLEQCLANLCDNQPRSYSGERHVNKDHRPFPGMVGWV